MLWTLKTNVNFFIIVTSFRKTPRVQEVPQKGSCGVLDRALDLTGQDLRCVPSWPAVCCRVSHLPLLLLTFLSSSLYIMLL